MSISEQELSYLRTRLESSFQSFVRYFFKSQKGSKFVFSWHHAKICDELMRLHRGEITNLIINMPPRYSKTELVVKMFSAWCMAINPRSEFIHLSYSDPLALSNSDTVRTLIKSKDYQQLWPHVTIEVSRDSKKAWGTKQGGVFYATSAGGSVTGFGAGRIDEFENGEYNFSGAIIIDDPLKPDDARSDTKREAVNTRWDETIKSRRNSKHTPVIVIMQRLHENDFCGMLLKDKELKWNHLVLPAILNEGSDNEKALWESKHNIDDLRAMRDKNKYMFAGQMQQSPTPLGGGKLSRDKFCFYSDHAEVFSRSTMLLFTADTAYTSKSTNDPSVIQLWGCESGERMYLLDQIREWYEFPDLLNNAKIFAETYGAEKRFYVEAKASGLSLVQSLRKVGINAAPWQPNHYGFPDDKAGRVNECHWTISNGSIWLPDDDIINSVTGRKMSFTEKFLYECERFTDDDTHEHDDQIDAMTMAVSIWRRYSGK